MKCKYYDPMYVEVYMTPTGICNNPKTDNTYCYSMCCEDAEMVKE